MYGYIYLTTNIVNNKKYIGQHRGNKFDPMYKGSGKLLEKAIRKYDKENFTTIILEECFSEDELNQKEKQYIDVYNAVNDDLYYNLASGGLGHTCSPWNKGLKGVQKCTEAQLAVLQKG